MEIMCVSVCVSVTCICVSGVSAIDVFTPGEVFVENGTTATLSCSFKSREVISSSASVTWSFLPEGEAGAFTSIFYYTAGKQFPGSVPQFKSRVEWAGDMNKKDGSIRVIQMQFKDNGTFSCDVKNPPDISGQMSFIKVRVVMKGERAARAPTIDAVFSMFSASCLGCVTVSLNVSVWNEQKNSITICCHCVNSKVHALLKSAAHAGICVCVCVSHVLLSHRVCVSVQGPVIYAQLDHSGSKNSFHKMEPVVYADIRKN
uniref:Myelin protein zero-like 1 like n=1 Tax=Cyprinus carpio TaxID=7962 RepID=A0A8C2G2P4_CYPCA